MLEVAIVIVLKEAVAEGNDDETSVEKLVATKGSVLAPNATIPEAKVQLEGLKTISVTLDKDAVNAKDALNLVIEPLPSLSWFIKSILTKVALPVSSVGASYPDPENAK